MEATMTALLEIKNLAVELSTRSGPVRVVQDVSLSVAPGEVLGVVGESGCGKSMTMLSLLGLLPNGARVASGTAMMDGKDLFSLPRNELRQVRGNRIGMIFQDPMTSFNPVMRIGDQLTEGLIRHRGMKREAARDACADLLDMVGVSAARSRLDNYPHELSGGMRQRVMIAMGIACRPPLLIADEPTTALDVTIQAQIVDVIRDLKAELGMSILWVTHDLALMAGLADRIVVLYAGVVVEEASVDELYESPMHPYTRGLLASLPRLEASETLRLPSIGGAPPDPGKRPVGCAFAPRCAFRIDLCETSIPSLTPVAPGKTHRAACWVTAGGSH
jgi:peptide/nickel transport system ATP-binding protein